MAETQAIRNGTRTRAKRKQVLTSLITSWSGRPADCTTDSAISGSVKDVDDTLPLSDEEALVLSDAVELFDALLLLLLLH
jgi:hypothetical protein